MAEAQDQVANAQEPSMEEILASIRKIIADDSETKPVDSAAPQPAAAPTPVPETKASHPSDDVIELTQVVQEDGSIVDVKDMKAETKPEIVEMAPPPVMVAPVVSPTPAKPLISDTTVTTSASSLNALATTVEIERLSSTPQGGSLLGNGNRTLEDMVIELMRPLLKDWLEKNLPAVVERLVQKEIERISRKSQS